MSIPKDIFTLLFFAVNLVFIVTNVYGWLLKRFFVPEAYRSNMRELFPAQQLVANFYLLQLLEVPYLLMVGQIEALFYANGTALLLFSSYMLIMVRSYFFLESPTRFRLVVFLLPVWLCWIVMLLPVFGVVEFSVAFRQLMTVVVLALFLGYLFLMDRFRKQLVGRIRELDEDEYSNEEDFPATFAKSIMWLPLVICTLLAVNFLINDPFVKLARDLIFTFINVWFAIYTLNPHRKVRQLPMELQQKAEEKEVVENEDSKCRLNEEQRRQMESRLLELVREDKLYLNDHLSMNDLVKRLHTNKTYLSEVIAHSEYGSFYQLINTLRIDHACWMLGEDPNLKMEQVALASGFSSGSAFSQVFKRIKGVSPSDYLRQ